MVKVLIPDFRLTLALWAGGVVLEAVTCNVWNLEGEKSVVKKPEERKIVMRLWLKTDVLETITKWTDLILSIDFL